MYLSKEDINSLIQKKDLTEDSNHCISLVIEKINNKLIEKYNLITSREKGDKIVSLDNNYYELGYGSTEVTLSSRYTKYINKNTILRTQMSSTIPSLLKSYKKDEDKLWICPGIVYRRDVRDRTHVAEPHQLDIWYLTKEIQSRENLLQLVQLIISIIEEYKKEKVIWRYNETSHHYTDGGIEVEIYYKNQWLELLECGLISQNLLIKNNLKSYSGLALGLGLERLVMIIKDIDDIRILYSEKPEIQVQLNNLNRYKRVSNQPSIKRDLSVSLNKNINEEELTELILSSVNHETQNIIESIKVISETDYEYLPQIAIERLGMNSSQKNILIRIILRDLEKTLTNKQANLIYTEIYEKIHKGSLGYKVVE